MYSLLKEIAICVFFLYFILMIAYTNRDPWSYRQYNNYNNMFNLGAFSPSYTVKFEEVNIDWLLFNFYVLSGILSRLYTLPLEVTRYYPGVSVLPVSFCLPTDSFQIILQKVSEFQFDWIKSYSQFMLCPTATPHPPPFFFFPTIFFIFL